MPVHKNEENRWRGGVGILYLREGDSGEFPALLLCTPIGMKRHVTEMLEKTANQFGIFTQPLCISLDTLLILATP